LGTRGGVKRIAKTFLGHVFGHFILCTFALS
jgi:hypothetical protein